MSFTRKELRDRKKESPSWEGCSTLLDWVEKVLKAGTEHDAEVIAAVKMLPVEKRGPYRALWEKYRGKRGK
jgi:hypothetical protein